MLSVGSLGLMRATPSLEPCRTNRIRVRWAHKGSCCLGIGFKITAQGASWGSFTHGPMLCWANMSSTLQYTTLLQTHMEPQRGLSTKGSSPKRITGEVRNDCCPATFWAREPCQSRMWRSGQFCAEAVEIKGPCSQKKAPAKRWLDDRSRTSRMLQLPTWKAKLFNNLRYVLTLRHKHAAQYNLTTAALGP